VPWLHGLKIVAVAVVAQAVWGMARSLCPDRERATLAVGAAVLSLAVPSAAGQIGAIIAGGLIGWQLSVGTSDNKAAPLAVHIARPFAVGAMVQAPDGFVGAIEPAFGQEILNVPVAEREAQIEPNGMLNDGRRETVPAV